MLVGSYGSVDEINLRSYSFDQTSGTVSPLDSLSGLSNPSFLALSDDGETVLTISEDDSYSAPLTMLCRQGSEGSFTPVASQAVIGKRPCHVTFSPDSKYAVTSNFSTGTISVFPIDCEKREIGKPRVVKFSGHGQDSIRQASSHPHFTTFSPDQRFMVVTDLGTDRLHLFPINDDGFPDLKTMLDVMVTPGFGPRHIVFDKKAENAYMINELTGNISHFRYTTYHDTLMPVNAYHADKGNEHSGGDIKLSPDGRFVYVSNRDNGDGISIFSIDFSNGWELIPVDFTPTGPHPANFNISPDGNWVIVACREGNSLEVYRRDHTTGKLSATDYKISVPQPACVVFGKES